MIKALIVDDEELAHGVLVLVDTATGHERRGERGDELESVSE